MGRPSPKFDRADALVAIAQDVVRGTRKNRSPIEVVISMAVETLRTATTTAVPDPCAVACFSDGTCVSAQTARRLACDCGVVEVTEDERGIPLSVGRRTRTSPGTMKRALLHRDKTCRFPGCTTRIFLEGHHIEHWIDGGATKLGNILSLCSHHHRHVHEYGFTIETATDGTVEFADDRGRLFKSVPDPVNPTNLGWNTILAQNEHLAITSETAACDYDGCPVDYHLAVDALIDADEQN